MGHDHHFLERLERLESTELKLALKLYNDSMLVEEIRKHPASASERFAVALTDDARGPHVILCRAGAFVTCLAAGMSTGASPVVPRSYVERCIAVTTRARGFSRDLNEFDRRGFRFGSLIHRGPKLLREDMRPLLGVAPLFHAEFLMLQKETFNVVTPALAAFQSGKPVRQSNEVVQRFWTTQWLIGNCALLLSTTDYAGWTESAEQTSKQFGVPVYSPFGYLARALGGLNPFLRALRASAAVGPNILERLLTGYRDDGNRIGPDAASEIFLHLSAIALAHPTLAPEIKRAIRTAPCTPYVLPLLPPEAQDLDSLFDRPELLAARHEAAGRALVADIAKRFSHRSPLARVRAEDVPAHLANAMALCEDIPIDGKQGGERLLPGLAFISRAKREEIFVSEEHAEVLNGLAWNRDATRAMIPRRRPMKPTEHFGPTRKGPCPCGSKKKYKHCCAEPEVARRPTSSSTFERSVCAA